MKRSAFASLLTVTATFISVLPAYAGPLDTYKGSILDPTSSTLSTDPRALCSDVVAHNTVERSSAVDTGNSFKNYSDFWAKAQRESAHSEHDKTSGGASFMGIGANASHESSSSNSAKSHDENKLILSSEGVNNNKVAMAEKTTTAVAAGRNCDAFVKASAERDAAAFAADAQVKMTQIATDGKVKATKIEADQRFMESLLKW